MKKTKVINLYGAPGSGKSTTAADLYALMKRKGHDVELVREYVKSWAYDKKPINYYDQLYITAKQAKAEYSLYGKVDYIITDSPILLGSFYSNIYNGIDVNGVILDLMRQAEKDGVDYLNYWIVRNKPYNPNGRYQTEEEAKKLDKELEDFLFNESQDVAFVNNAEEIFENLFGNEYKQTFRGETD